METLAIIFAIGLFIYLNAPKKPPPKPKDPWEEMGKAIGNAAKTLAESGKEEKGSGGGKAKGGGGGKAKDSGEILWVVALSALVGILIIYLS